MAKVHIGNLVEIRHWIVPDKDVNDNGYWVTQDRFQNVNTTTTISYGGQNYSFLSFIYQGATRSRTGDNIQASLMVTTWALVCQPGLITMEATPLGSVRKTIM